MDGGKYSVCQLKEDGSAQHLAKLIGLAEAVELFSSYVSAASSGRVIVSDGQVSLEWTYEGGFRKG